MLEVLIRVFFSTAKYEIILGIQPFLAFFSFYLTMLVNSALETKQKCVILQHERSAFRILNGASARSCCLTKPRAVVTVTKLVHIGSTHFVKFMNELVEFLKHQFCFFYNLQLLLI